ncbi:MAG TPA: hypothetical protein PLV52_06575, partial [Candidatus Omnitrophota bacterium]|nr:hypothetical protein [Candidatus Omnitrophota bacterium]
VNPDQFTIGYRPASPVSIYGINRYLSFLFPEHERGEISIFKLFGNDDKEPSIVFVLGSDYEEDRILRYKDRAVTIKVDETRSPRGFRGNARAQRIEISEIMLSQGAIDDDTYQRYIKYKPEYDRAAALSRDSAPQARGNLVSQIECLENNLPQDKRGLAAIVAREVLETGFVSKETFKELLGVFGYTGITRFQGNGTWPIYYLLRESARRYGLIKNGGGRYRKKILELTPSKEEVETELLNIPEENRWLKYLRDHHPRLYTWVRHYDLLPSRKGRSRLNFKGDDLLIAVAPKKEGRRSNLEKPPKEPARKRAILEAAPLSTDGISEERNSNIPETPPVHIMSEEDLLNNPDLTWLDEVVFSFLQNDDMSYISSGYGQRIKDLRHRASIRQPELAGRVTLKDPVTRKPVPIKVYRLFEIEEEEGHIPMIDEVAGIASALNVRPEYILRGEDPPDWDSYNVPVVDGSVPEIPSVDDILAIPLLDEVLFGPD